MGWLAKGRDEALVFAGFCAGDVMECVGMEPISYEQRIVFLKR